MPSHPRTVLEMIFLEAIALQAKGYKVALTSSPNPSKQQRGKTKQERCYRCGQEGHFSKDKCCQASQTTCIKCKKVVHYAILCKTKPSSDSATRGQSSGKRRVLVETEYQEGVFEEEAFYSEQLWKGWTRPSFCVGDFRSEGLQNAIRYWSNSVYLAKGTVCSAFC